MSKPRLTATVLRGLSVMAGVAEAGSPADLLGYEWESLDAEGKADWRAVERAIAWVYAIERHRRAKTSPEGQRPRQAPPTGREEAPEAPGGGTENR